MQAPAFTFQVRFFKAVEIWWAYTTDFTSIECRVKVASERQTQVENIVDSIRTFTNAVCLQGALRLQQEDHETVLSITTCQAIVSPLASLSNELAEHIMDKKDLV